MWGGALVEDRKPAPCMENNELGWNLSLGKCLGPGLTTDT